APEGEHDSIAKHLRESPRAFTDVGLAGVRLPEMRLTGVEKDRLPPCELVPERFAEARVPTLGHARHHFDGRGAFLVVVDVEVFGLQDLEVELFVANRV